MSREAAENPKKRVQVSGTAARPAPVLTLKTITLNYAPLTHFSSMPAATRPSCTLAMSAFPSSSV